MVKLHYIDSALSHSPLKSQSVLFSFSVTTNCTYNYYDTNYSMFRKNESLYIVHITSEKVFQCFGTNILSYPLNQC